MKYLIVIAIFASLMTHQIMTLDDTKPTSPKYSFKVQDKWHPDGPDETFEETTKALISEGPKTLTISFTQEFDNYAYKGVLTHKLVAAKGDTEPEFETIENYNSKSSIGPFANGSGSYKHYTPDEAQVTLTSLLAAYKKLKKANL